MYHLIYDSEMNTLINRRIMELAAIINELCEN